MHFWKKATLFVLPTILLFSLLTGCSKTEPLPEIPENGIQIKDVGSHSLQFAWKPAVSEDSDKLYYKALIVTDSEILSDSTQAATIAGEEVLMDWSLNKFSAQAENLEPSTEYYVSVLVRLGEGSEVVYSPVMVITKKEISPQLIADSKMGFVQGGTYNFFGKDIQLEDFYISRYEITYGTYIEVEKWAYETVLSKDYTKNTYEEDYEYPAAVSWYEALIFCNYLSMISGLEPVYYADENLKNPLDQVIARTMRDFYINNDATGYRLPTEVEWEYAASGGQQTKDYIYAGSNNPDEVAWYLSNPYDTKTGGQKKPNELGLYDMSGNEAEWCIDYWDENGITDRSLFSDIFYYNGSTYGPLRVAKGGFFFDPIYTDPDYGEFKPTIKDLEITSRKMLLLNARGKEYFIAGFRVVKK